MHLQSGAADLFQFLAIPNLIFYKAEEIDFFFHILFEVCHTLTDKNNNIQIHACVGSLSFSPVDAIAVTFLHPKKYFTLKS